MATLGNQFEKPTLIPPASINNTNGDPSALGRILKYKVLIVCLTLILVGILFLVLAPIVSTKEGLLGHLLRDIGIVLITTGLVVFAADYFTRKDFIALLTTKLQPIQDEVRTLTQSTISEMTPLKTDMSSLVGKLLQEITPLRQDIPTLSTALDDIRQCISLGVTMSVLGIKQIYPNRTRSNLFSKLHEAPSQSEIKILGIVASEVDEPGMENLIQQKLREGCKFKLLFLNPSSSFVEQRAAEERRGAREMRAAISARINGWQNFVERHVNEEMRSQIELRCYDSTIRYFLFITGTLVVVGFYLGSTRGANALHLELEIKDDGIAPAFIEHFDSLWDEAKGLAAT
jgi:hypothetical protein